LPSSSSPESARALTPMKRCRGVYDGSFGSALAFAAKAYQHTACQLGEMAKDPDTGMKRFAHSALAKAQDLCLPYCGMHVERVDDPRHGFVFRSPTCSGVCSSSTHCSDCASRTSTALREIKRSIKPECNGEKINPQTMNTNTVEWHFGNARQMVGRSTNKLTAAGFDNADKKTSTFNTANMAIVGNNSPGVNIFDSKKQY
jgi:hypothetical protein